MLIEDIRKIKGTPKELRDFGLLVGGVIAVLGALAFWFGRPAAPYLLSVGAALVMGGIAAPSVLRPLHKVWMSMALVMGFVMTRVILSVLFYVVFTAIGLLMRLFGKKLLDLRYKDGRDSYWHVRDTAEFDREHYKRQF